MLLPCQNDPEAVEQIRPAIEMLQKLDSQHPRILKAHGLQPSDYHNKLVFRSAVESIRGSYIASSLTQRHGLVAATLEVMKQSGLIADYKGQGSTQRFDFQVMLESNPKKMVALEVKGGEGNSINISDRPLWANEFILWCNLDGAIVNQPSHGAGAIIFNRIENEMILRHKHVDAVLFRDALCNSPLRPCPKYTNIPPTPLGVAPDIFLLPKNIPTLENPTPAPHDLTTTLLPKKILDAYGVSPQDYDKHIWQVHIRLHQNSAGRVSRETEVYYQGKQIEWRRPRK